MGCCCGSTPEMKEARELSKKIERKLRRQKERENNEFKLLLLGCGESGKSTFIKQMKIIHGEGYSKHEALSFIPNIHQNVIAAVKCLCQMMVDLNIKTATSKNITRDGGHIDDQVLQELEKIGNLSAGADLIPFKETLISAWYTHAFQACFEFGSKFNLPDSANFFLSPENIQRILSPDYTPSQADILRTRVATTGIMEFMCSVKGVLFRLVDVGGQRSERRKWIHCFDNVTSIIFIASLSEFDRTLIEASSVNRTHESLSLFSAILRYPCFSTTSIILFLNKYDLLKEKIKTTHIRDYFPDYDGPKEDFHEAKMYFFKKYTSCNTNSDRTIYSHFTCATDTDNIKFVFEAVKDTILQNHLKDYSLI